MDLDLDPEAQQVSLQPAGAFFLLSYIPSLFGKSD